MFHYGVDYYPEHWPEERWPVDARMMAEAGFNVVRLAEFAWSKLEPEEGHFDFDWLDRVLAILSDHGIRAILGTPTASPPPWLMAKDSGMFRVREDGQRVTYGNRREYCPNHPLYRDHSCRIVTAMAEHYAGHPAVLGWQIDNEFGDRCYCPVCRQAFGDWLAQRYASLDDLNLAWGTIFWSHVYNDWVEIPTPVQTGGAPNPGLALDYARFCSDSYVEYQKLQVDILRRQCPGHLVTHNFMGFRYDQIEYYNLARDLDLVAWDNYPRTQWGMGADVDASAPALGHDTMRGLRGGPGGQNFWVMEEQSGPGGWQMVSVPPRPGEIRLWAYQAIAHGADAIIYFRWRTARFGTEQYWHGILDHHAQPGRRYAEVKQMGDELKHIGEIIQGTRLRPAVAMLQDYDARWAFQIQGNNPGFAYPRHFQEVYRALHARQVGMDVVSPMHDLSSYRLVVAPALHLVSPALAEKLEHFVAQGGVLVLTARSGVKDPANNVVNQYLPGLLAGLAGAHVEDYDSLPEGARVGLEVELPTLDRALTLTFGEQAALNLPCESRCATTWCDILVSDGAQVVARYSEEYYAGRPAITLNSYGKGQVVYIGTLGPAALFDALAPWLLALGGVQPVLRVPAGVEVAERWQGESSLLFVLNHTGQAQEITLPRAYRDLLDTGKAVDGQVTLPARGVMILA